MHDEWKLKSGDRIKYLNILTGGGELCKSIFGMGMFLVWCSNNKSWILKYDTSSKSIGIRAIAYQNWVSLREIHNGIETFSCYFFYGDLNNRRSISSWTRTLSSSNINTIYLMNDLIFHKASLSTSSHWQRWRTTAVATMMTAAPTTMTTTSRHKKRHNTSFCYYVFIIIILHGVHCALSKRNSI